MAKQILLVAISKGRETDPIHNPDLPPPLSRQRATLPKGAAGKTLSDRRPVLIGGERYFFAFRCWTQSITARWNVAVGPVLIKTVFIGAHYTTGHEQARKLMYRIARH